MAKNQAYLKKVEIGTASLPLNTATLNRSRAQIDSTDFSQMGLGFESSLPGLKDWGISANGFFSATNAALAALEAAWLAGTAIENVKYLPDGSAGEGGTVILTSLAYKGDIGGLETFDLAMTGTGARSAQNLAGTATNNAKHQAYLVTIKKSGTPTAMSDEALGAVAESTTVFQITDATKRVVDTGTSISFKANNVAVNASKVGSFDYLTGKVTFTEAQTAPITMSGKYMPMSAIANAKSYSLTLSAKVNESTSLDDTNTDPAKTYLPGPKNVALEVGRFDDLSGDLADVLDAATPIVVEIRQGGGTIIRRGWFVAVKDDESGGVQDLESESISFALSGNALAGFSLGR